MDKRPAEGCVRSRQNGEPSPLTRGASSERFEEHESYLSERPSGAGTGGRSLALECPPEGCRDPTLCDSNDDTAPTLPARRTCTRHGINCIPWLVLAGPAAVGCNTALKIRASPLPGRLDSCVHHAAFMRPYPDDKSESNSVRPDAQPPVDEAAMNVIGDVQANRSPDRSFRAPPLDGFSRRETSSLCRDESSGIPQGEIAHGYSCEHLGLSERRKRDFVEYIRALLKCTEKNEQGETG